MNAYTQPCVSCFKYIEMNTKEGGKKGSKGGKNYHIKPFAAGCMDKNVLPVTPVK